MTGNMFLVSGNTTLSVQVQDFAGNSTGTTVTINNIDSTLPFCNVSYHITGSTNQDVLATLTGCTPHLTLTNTGGDTHTFTQNGTFLFTYQDHLGRTGSTMATVTRIDKDPPQVVSITYSPSTTTAGPVVATITLNETGTVV
jgi:hypothetical protein